MWWFGNVVCGRVVVVCGVEKKPCKVWLLHCEPDKQAAKLQISIKKRLLQIKINRKQYRLINIAKGTTDPRVEFILPK